jgi:hypothetical protein
MDHVDISGNSATTGGGMYLDYYSSPVLTQAEISGNSAVDGAGIYAYTSGPQLYASVVTGNIASGIGGGFKLYYYANPLIYGSIVAYNRASTGGNHYSDFASIPTLTDSDLYNPAGFGTDNAVAAGTYLTVEPAFLAYASSSGASCSPGSTDCLPLKLHLAATSPLINLGSADALDPDGTRADMGSYGGPGADDWDRDADGIPDYFWPGSWQNPPADFSSSSYDCDDRNPSTQGC